MRSAIREVAVYQPARTLFTRFMPASNPEAEIGQWRTYYRRWQSMTRERIDPELLALVPELQALVPPAMVFNKRRYSPWVDGRLHSHYGNDAQTLHYHGRRNRRVRDRNRARRGGSRYRVIVVRDALCSVSDAAHDAALRIDDERFNQQVETCTVQSLLSGWQRT